MQGFRMVPAGSSQFYLLLTARDDQMTGKLYGPGAKTGLPFTSLSRMVLQLEELMDTRGDAWEPWAPPEGFPKEALELEILFRQNYSWQGRLRLPKICKEAVFRSVLELLLIIETYFES